jgi:polysaccharide deacetylase family sporulation protein PdaB
LKRNFNITKHLPKKIKNTLQIILMLIVFTFLTVVFYIIPETKKLQNTSSSNVSSIKNGSGIGGGDIIGNSRAGKKDLPIYCVDIASKIKQQDNNNNTSTTSPNDNSTNTSAQNKNINNSLNFQNNTITANSTINNTSITFSSDKKYVSLSFDAAWGADDTIHILDTLDKFNVKVTFFMTGGWVNEYPDMVKEIYSRGHDLGNHSQNHKKMSELNTTEQKQELQSVTDKVKELTGYDMFLFRPPYGDYNSTLINTAYSLNYYPIQWSVDSLDWKDYGVDNIIKTVTTHKALDNGAIILMHNGAKYTAQALESVITNLQNQGYTLVPISELIIRNNFHMDANGMQVAD